MLTRSNFQNACQTAEPPNFKKWDCVTLSWKVHIVMAKLQADATSPVTHNVCDENLLNARFWVHLDSAELVPSTKLSECVRQRAMNFV